METTTLTDSREGVAAFIRKVYGWMAGGLAVTALTAFIVTGNRSLIGFFIQNPVVFYGLLILELVIVFYLSARVQKMSSSQAGVVFVLYALINGLTFSVFFLAYTASSIYLAFLLSAGMFAVMSIYGAVTKKDLTSIGSIAIMALIGLILASVVNMFLQSPALYWITSYLGVIIFSALIAYDTQKVKGIYVMVASAGEEAGRKGAIMGALSLYLDFVNMFIYVLRIVGGRRG
jgi:FtsH-binding integral membrane protein